MTYDLEGLDYIAKNIAVPFKARIDFMAERVVVKLEKSGAVEVGVYDRKFWVSASLETRKRHLDGNIRTLKVRVKARMPVAGLVVIS